jgi:thioredoxin-related protein
MYIFACSNKSFMTVNRFIIVLSVMISFLHGAALTAQRPSDTVQWLSWDEGIAKAGKEGKKVLVYVYTQSCGWCRKMETETFHQTAITQLVRNNFIPVRLNAAEQSDLDFNGKTYKYVQSGTKGYHTLVAEVLNGRMSFPSLVFMDEAQQTLQSIAGYKTAEEFLPIALYYGNGFYKTMPWSAFQKKYASGN